MRTDEEILKRIEQIKDRDWLGFERNDLIMRLSFESAKQFLSEGTTKDDWNPLPKDRESLLNEMLGYMSFAWDKANGGRGLSAGRTMNHYSAWIWLAGDDLGDLNNYQYYGKDNLCKICDYYGWDSSKWDDGVRIN